MVGRFSPIPDPDADGMGSWQYGMLQNLKENVDLLTGARGEPDGASGAILRSAIKVKPLGKADMAVRAQGQSVPTENGAKVPTIEDHNQLIEDVRQMANAMTALQDTLNLLITQIRS